MALQVQPSSSLLKHLPTPCIAILFFFLSLLFVISNQRRKNKFNLPPSPPKLPIIGNLHQLGTLPHRSFQALSRKYGPLLLLQLGQTPTLLISSVDVAKEVSKTHDVAFSNKPQTTAVKTIMYGCTDVAFSPYGEEWRQKRKICVLDLLSVKRVRSFQSIREEEVAAMLGAIREACNASKRPSCVNLSQILIETSNNIISRCVLGKKYDNPDGGISFGQLGRKMMKHLATFTVGDFFPLLGWIDVVTGQIPEFKATFRALDSFFDQLIAERKRIMKREGYQPYNKDFLETLLQIQDGAGKHDFHLTHDDVKAILTDIFAGGSDTTSTLLEWVFAALLKNPDTMKRAQEEVRRVVGYKLKVDENDLNQMNYLKCVVKETLRLYPPIPLLTPRETSSDVKVKGFDIPSKTRVFVNAWAIQRDPEIWNRPEEFLPERFEDQPEVDFKGKDLQFIPFGFGRRGCIGISFALASTEYMLANLLYWFDWKIPQTGKPMQDVDMSEIWGLTVIKKVPLHLQPELHSFGYEH